MSATDVDIPDGVSGRRDDLSGPLGISIIYSVSPGRIEIDGEVNGTVETGGQFNILANRLASQFNPEDTVRVNFTTERTSSLRSGVNDLADTIATESNLPMSAVQSIVQGAGGLASSRIQDTLSEVDNPASVELDLLNVLEDVGDGPANFTKEIEFPTIPVPRTPGAASAIDQLPDPTLVVEVRPTNTVQNAIAQLSGSVARVEFDVPSWAFFNLVEPEGVSCSQAYENIDRRIDQLRSTVRSASDGYIRDADVLDNIVDRLPSIEGGGGSDFGNQFGTFPDGGNRFGGVVTRVRDVSTSRIREELSQSELDSIISRLEEVQPNRVRPGVLRGRFEDLREQAEDIELERCRSNFIDRLDSMEPGLETIENLQPQVEELANVLSSALPAEVQLPEGPADLSCADVSQSLRNRARGFSSAASRFTGGSRASQLDNEGEELVSDIRDEVSADNPCRAELLDQVRSGLTRVRQQGERREIPTVTPCSEEYPSLDRDVEDFFDNAINLSPTAGPQQVSGLISQGRDIIQRIDENVERQRCAENFSSTVRSALDRIDRLQGEVRIRTGEQVGQLPEERRQQLDQIISDLEGITQQFGGDLEGIDLPEGVEPPEQQ